MALVNLQPVLDAIGGDAAVSAVFTATVYKAKRAAPRIDGDTVHFPQPITCNWDGTAWDHIPELDTLPLPYYWHTTVSAGGTRITRDVQLATPVTAVDFADLADIVPDSGEPDVTITQYQATLQQINAAVLTVTSTQQQILDTEASLQALIAQSNAGVASITPLLQQAQDAAGQAQINVSAQILSQHAEDITLFDPAGAAAAVTLASLGGITPDDTDSKISTALAAAPYIAKPSGGTDGQALVKSGTAVTWGSVSSTGGGTANGISVKDAAYGAKGDGATDDTAAFTAWWNAIKGGGITGIIPDGTYLTTGLVFTGGSNFTIKATRDAVIWNSKSTTAAPRQSRNNVLTITDSSDFTVDGVTVDGRRDLIAKDQYLTANATSGTNTITVQDGTDYVVGEMVWVMGGTTVNSGGERNRNDAFLNVTGISGNVLTLSGNLTQNYTATGASGGAFVTRYQTGDSSHYTVAGRALGNEDAQNGIHLIACSRFTVQNCTARNVWESPIRLGVGISTQTPTDGCTDGTITGNDCFHGYDQGIAVWLSERITVSNNRCTDAGWAGISFTHSRDCVATGNICTGNIYSPASDVDEGVGIAAEGSIGVQILGNICTGNNRDGIRLNRSPVYMAQPTLGAGATAGATTLTVTSTSGMVVGSSYVLIANGDDTTRENFFVTAVPSGTTLTIADPLRASYPSGSNVNPRYNQAVTINGNTCSKNKLGAGIKISNGIAVTVQGNNCLDNGLGVDRQGTYGIEIRDYSHGTTVSNNTVARNSQDGISIDTVKNVQILGNHCYSNGVAGGQKNGIRSWGTITDCVFQNNQCDRNTLNGIHLDTVGNRHTISGNYLHHNSGRGLMVYGPATGLNIVGNRASYNSEPGIDLRGVSSSVLSGNDCSNNNQEGIRLDDNGTNYCIKNIVASNLLYDDRGTGPRSQPYGLHELGNTASSLVSGNRAYGNTATDLSLAASSTSLNNITG